MPEAVPGRPKWRIALDELDRTRAAGATFGGVPADAEYGKAAAFRRGLSERGLLGAVGVRPTQKVDPPGRRDRRAGAAPADGPAAQTPQALGRKRERERQGSCRAALPEAAFRGIAWRRGTKGPLRAEFAALRIRVADGPEAARAQHRPGEAAPARIAGSPFPTTSDCECGGVVLAYAT